MDLSLPNEILLEIFSFLPQRKCDSTNSTDFTTFHMVVPCVCRTFYEIWKQAKHFFAYQYIRVQQEQGQISHGNSKEVNSSVLTSALFQYPKLNSVHVHIPKIEESIDMSILVTISKIGTSNLSSFNTSLMGSVSPMTCVSDQFVRLMVQQFKDTLISINFAGNKSITVKSVARILSKCKQLKYFNISHCQGLYLTKQQQMQIQQSQTPSASLVSTLIDTDFSLDTLCVSSLHYGFDLTLAIRLITEKKVKNLIASHLAHFKFFTIVDFTNLFQISPTNAELLYDLALINCCENALQHCKNLLMTNPSADVIESQLRRGNHRIVKGLKLIDYPINTIAKQVIEEALLENHVKVVNALRACGYNRFNEMDANVVAKLCQRGQMHCISELRLCRYDQFKKIPISSLEVAVCNGHDSILQQFYELNYSNNFEEISIEAVNTAVSKGHSGIIKFLNSVKYPKIQSIAVESVREAMKKSNTTTLLQQLQNAGYTGLNEIAKEQMLNTESTNTKEVKSKKKKK